MATILFVDDDVAVLFVISELLRRQGHTVIPVQDALRASEVCRTYPDPIDLLITDIVMPGIDGVALAKQLHAMRLEMKVLYTSGYGNVTLQDRGVPKNVPLLTKPCDAGEVFRSVQQALSHGDETAKCSRCRKGIMQRYLPSVHGIRVKNHLQARCTACGYAVAYKQVYSSP